jgi:hypothetical protein
MELSPDNSIVMVIELDDGKICRKSLYLMVKKKNMVSGEDFPKKINPLTTPCSLIFRVGFPIF